jgi:hypothetical protein
LRNWLKTAADAFEFHGFFETFRVEWRRRGSEEAYDGFHAFEEEIP